VDAREKNKQATAVRRRFTAGLERHGFRHTKTSFWVREREHVVEFIHLHLFRHSPAFRVHLGIRVLNDSFVAPALNGPHSPDGWFGDPARECLEFSDDPDSVARCAQSLLRFADELALPWFRQFADPHVLVTAADSPLQQDARMALAEALSGKSAPEQVAKSRSLLGLVRAAAEPDREATGRG